MQGEFEKKLQGKMQDFRLEPSPQVWSDVELALKEKKRRRFVIWWWLLPAVIAGGVAVWYFGFNNTTKNDAAVITSANQQVAKESNSENNIDTTTNTASITNDKNIAINKTTPELNNTKTGNENENLLEPPENKTTVAATRQKITAVNGIKDYTGKETTTESASMHVNNGTVNSNTKANNTVTTNITAEAGKGEEDKTANNVETSAAKDLSADTTALAISILKEKELKETKDSTVAPVNITARKDSKDKKKGSWYIHAEAGNITASETKIFQSATAYPSFYYSNSVGQLNGGNYNYGTPDSTFHIIKSQNGFHINAGINYQYSVSRRWTIDAGLHAMYFSNKQQAGKYVDKVLDVAKAYDTNTGSVPSRVREVSVPGFYQAGYSNNIRNNALLLETPLNIVYTINPNATTKFRLNAGGSYAFVMSSKWLLPDARNNKLYYSKTLLENNIFSWQAGVALQIKNNWQFGMQYKRSFTTIADKTLEPKLHWQYFSFYTNIPLPHKK